MDNPRIPTFGNNSGNLHFVDEYNLQHPDLIAAIKEIMDLRFEAICKNLRSGVISIAIRDFDYDSNSEDGKYND